MPRRAHRHGFHLQALQNLKETVCPPTTHLKQPNHKALSLNPINFPNSHYEVLITYNRAKVRGERNLHSSWQISNQRSSSEIQTLHIIINLKKENTKRCKITRLWSPVHIISSTYKTLNTTKLPLCNAVWFNQQFVLPLSKVTRDVLGCSMTTRRCTDAAFLHDLW